MLCIKRKETDPLFNLAAEEYLLKNHAEDIFSIWINDPSIVVGKHQNALAEVNYWHAAKNNIPVIRRISGGGTVYHDHGNLNYSFILSGERDRLVDYRKHTRPVIDFLSTLGIEAHFEGKSNLVVNGLKFSGNSAHVWKNRVVHHGTILFNSDLDALRSAISPARNNYKDKSVRSVRADVANLSGFLANKLTIHEFAALFFEYVMNKFSHSGIYHPDDIDRESIAKLAAEKYSTWEWNFGYSPDYDLVNEFEDKGASWRLRMKVSKGIIREFLLIASKMHPLDEFERIMTGVPHREDKIREIFDNVNFADDNLVSKEVLIKNMF